MIMNTKNRRNSKKQITGMKRKLSRKSRLIMRGGMILYVENIHTREKITLDIVDPNENIVDIIRVVSDKINIREEFLHLYFNGTQLKDYRLQDYKIKPRDTIYLRIRKIPCPQCRLEGQIASLREDRRFRVEPFDEPIDREIKETERLREEKRLRDEFKQARQMYPMCTEHSEHSEQDVDDQFHMR